jgi:hypothetical protein
MNLRLVPDLVTTFKHSFNRKLCIAIILTPGKNHYLQAFFFRCFNAFDRPGFASLMLSCKLSIAFIEVFLIWNTTHSWGGRFKMGNTESFIKLSTFRNSIDYLLPEYWLFLFSYNVIH